ncbi:hypothetical protein CKY39_20815 [Variovorax boronicumulans]|uniref:Uncharacterized protein n=1 Tax=Variovorax boronicumulans TaxID=436515 RepID=A0A250DN21_9BURK|nr:hypothetical protein CKY39_20815 [Variovorax boronicumulans]
MLVQRVTVEDAGMEPSTEAPKRPFDEAIFQGFIRVHLVPLGVVHDRLEILGQLNCTLTKVEEDAVCEQCVDSVMVDLFVALVVNASTLSEAVTARVVDAVADLVLEGRVGMPIWDLRGKTLSTMSVVIF